jgi:hypothetical protein
VKTVVYVVLAGVTRVKDPAVEIQEAPPG